MGFCEAWKLIQSLEGGKVNNPHDRGGPTNIGMCQQTWRDLGYPDSVMDASCGQIASAYRKLWDALKLYNLKQPPFHEVLLNITPEPADSVAMQFYINVPNATFIRAFQGCIGSKMDGILGVETWKQLQSWNGRGVDLSEKLLISQHWFYQGLPDGPFKQGWLNRVEAVKQWMAQQ